MLGASRRLTVLGTGLFVLAGCFVAFYRRRRASKTVWLQRAENELHPLLAEHTEYHSYTTEYATYPRIRTFYHAHSHLGKHESIGQLPLLVFLHGLGGVLPQFAPILGSLNNIAPCFGIELPGHGRSTFEPRNSGAYSFKALASLCKTAIEDICHRKGHTKVVLIGHSMGCSISALLASNTAKASTLQIEVVGMVAICPRIQAPKPAQVKQLTRLLTLPDMIINLFRWFDRFGAEDSVSVRRIVGAMNEPDLRRLQHEWNRQFKTAVLRQYMTNIISTDVSSAAEENFPSEHVWQGIQAPLLLIAGASDELNLPSELAIILEALLGIKTQHEQCSSKRGNGLAALTNGLETERHQRTLEGPSISESGRTQVVESIILPPPAAHALLYAHTTYRLVAAVIESFLATEVHNHLDFSYQLQLLTTTGKWDVKNLQKWKAVLPVSGPIYTKDAPNGLFRALKTMREQDDEHTPKKFLEQWNDRIYCVVDISHDVPVYDTKSLDKGGVEYHKFPTVSKIPPTPIEVQDFCSLVDKLIFERDGRGQQDKAIGVHCHYGYNRTGFFIVAYLVLRKGYDLETAVEEFKRAKPPGIRHEHFLDVLWLRYANGPGTEDTKGSDKLLDDDQKLEKQKKKDKKAALLNGDTDRAMSSALETPVEVLSRTLSYYEDGLPS